MKEAMVICSICGKPFYEQYGNNAEPVNDGVCCRTCNSLVVLPARFKLAKEWDSPKGGVQ